jgi:general secretion pathway protein L
MPQRILALDITDSDLKAAVVETTFRDYKVASFHRESMSAVKGTVEEQVRRFVEQHLHGGDTVLTALPGDRVTWRTLFLPFRDQKRLIQTVPFELESNVPFGLDEVIVDYQVLHRDRAGTLVLAALTPKEELERHLELLRQAGVDPKVVGVSPLAALNTLNLVPDLPPTFVFIDLTPRYTTLALYRDKELVGLRTLTHAAISGGGESGNGAGSPSEASESPVQALIGELRWTLLALNEAPLDERVPCYAAGEPAIVEEMQRELASSLGLDVRRLDRLRLRNLAAAASEAPAYTSTLGLALREVAPSNSVGVNFRRGEFAFHRSEQELRRALRGVAALAALVVALTVGDLYAEYHQMAARSAAVDAQIQKVFSATLPDMGRVADPAAALQSEIDALSQRVDLLNDVVPVSSSTGVDIMRAVSSAVPKKIRIDSEEYSMDADAVRLRANTDTFESVDAIKQELLNTGYFSDVQVKDAKAAKDGNGVDFRLNMVLSKAYRPRGGKP